MTRLYSSVLLAVGLLLSGGAAHGLETISLVVPGHVEFDPTPTSMRFEVEWQTYQEAMAKSPPSFERFAARPSLDPAEAAFVDLMGALRQGKDLQVSKFLRDPQAVASDGRIAGRIDRWRKAFKGFREVEILGRARLGELELFLWQTPSQTQDSFLRAFGMHEMEGSGFRADMVSSQTPVQKLVLEALEKKLRKPEPFSPDQRPRPLPGFEDYRYTLPVDDVPGAAVDMVFRARTVYFDVFDASAGASGEILDFYRDTWALFKAERFEDFEARYTPGSAAKVRKYLDQLTPDQQKAFHQTVLQGRRVWAVLEAEPLYLVFYSSGPGGSTDGILRYDTVVRDSASGELKLTNHFYLSHFDNVLRDKEVFAGTPGKLRARVLGLSASP